MAIQNLFNVIQCITGIFWPLLETHSDTWWMNLWSFRWIQDRAVMFWPLFLMIWWFDSKLLRIILTWFSIVKECFVLFSKHRDTWLMILVMIQHMIQDHPRTLWTLNNKGYQIKDLVTIPENMTHTIHFNVIQCSAGMIWLFFFLFEIFNDSVMIRNHSLTIISHDSIQYDSESFWWSSE